MLTEKELGDSGETTGCWEPSQKMALVEAAERGLVSRDKGNRVWLQEQLLWTAGESILERGGEAGLRNHGSLCVVPSPEHRASGWRGRFSFPP